MATLQELLYQAYGIPMPINPTVQQTGPLTSPIIQGPTRPPTTAPPPGTTPPPGTGGNANHEGHGNPFTSGFKPNDNPHAAFNRAIRPGHGAGSQGALMSGLGGGDDEDEEDQGQGAAHKVNQMVGNVFQPQPPTNPAWAGNQPPTNPAWQQEPPQMRRLRKVAPRFMHTMQGLQNLKTQRGY